MASGLCDNFLMATYLSATCKTVIVPAMDEEMWLHPSTQNNIKTLASFGNDVVEPREGLLASGLIGKGRLPEPEELVTILEETYFRSNVLAGKNILITAGPTEEPRESKISTGNCILSTPRNRSRTLLQGPMRWTSGRPRKIKISNRIRTLSTST